MNLKQVFARAAVRRVAVLLVTAVFALLAQCAHAYVCTVTSAHCTEGQANAEAQQECALFPGPPTTSFVCKSVRKATYSSTIGYYYAYGGYPNCVDPPGSPTCGNVSNKVFYYDLDKTCKATDPPLGDSWVVTDTYEQMQNTVLACKNGCTYVEPTSDTTIDYKKVDGKFYQNVNGWIPVGEPCASGTPTTGTSAPPADSDGDGTSNGNDSSPNNPGSDGGGGQNGTDQPEDGAPAKPCVPTPEKPCQGNGAGEGSGNGNTSGGGGDCRTPPSSSGDAILAQIAFQTWATRCAVSGLANQGGGTGGTGTDMSGVTSRLDAIRKWLSGEGQTLPEAPAMPFIESDAEQSNWTSGLGSGSCPPPYSATVTFMGSSQEIAFEFDPLCQFVELLRPVFISLCVLLGAFIVAGVRR